MHIDEALASIRKCASELGYSCKEGTINESRIDCVYSLNNVNINVWYSAKDKFFGFDMFQGGQKTYGNINDFKKYISLYMSINAILVPTAKAIADKFEKEIGVNSVYQNFKGNQDTGFTCCFNILNKENCGIKIKKISKSSYLAQYIVQDEMGGHVEAEKNYVVDDAGNIYVQATIKDYIEKLYARYAKSDSINIRRYGECDFEFDIDGKIHINASVEIVDILQALSNEDGVSQNLKFYYKVHSALTLDGKELIEDGDVDVKLSDIFDLNSLADYFLQSISDDKNESDDNDFEYDDDDDAFEEDTFEQKDSISSMRDIIDEKKPKLSGLDDLVENQDDDFEDDLEEDFEDSNTSDEDASDDSFDDDFEEDDYDDEPEDVEPVPEDEPTSEEAEPVQEVEPTLEDTEPVSEDDLTSEEAEPVEETKISEEETNSTPEEVLQGTSNLLEIKIILDVDGTKVGVRFSYSDKIYDMSLDAAKEAGLPINFIQSTVERKTIRGMLITDEEFSRRIFAEDISENKDMCKNLVNDFFM